MIPAVAAALLEQALAEAEAVLAELRAAERTLALPGEMYRRRGRIQVRGAISRLERGIRQARLFKP